jgi:hypothetical protein
MAKRGLNTAGAALLQLFTYHTGAVQRKRRIPRSVKDLQDGRFDLWETVV